jgi:hypothetical protein
MRYSLVQQIIQNVYEYITESVVYAFLDIILKTRLPDGVYVIIVVLYAYLLTKDVEEMIKGGVIYLAVISLLAAILQDTLALIEAIVLFVLVFIRYCRHQQ